MIVCKDREDEREMKVDHFSAQFIHDHFTHPRHFLLFLMHDKCRVAALCSAWLE